MYKKLSHILVLFFVLIMLGTQPSLYWFFLKNEQHNAYHQSQHCIALNQIKKTYALRVPSQNLQSSLKWKNDHEFYKDGYICDIVSIEEEGQQIIITYIHDKKETEIESNIRKLFSKDFTHKKRTKKHKSAVVLLYYINSISHKTDLFANLKSLADYCQPIYHSINVNPPNPPPQY